MPKATILLLCFLTATTLARSANAQGVVIEGVADCGQWVAARDQKQSGYRRLQPLPKLFPLLREPLYLLVKLGQSQLNHSLI